MNRWIVGLGTVVFGATLLPGASPASATPFVVDFDLTGVSVSADGPSQQTSVAVKATLDQNDYQDIVYRVTLQGFKVTKPIASQPVCPLSAVRVDLPAGVDVTSCALSQKGTSAVLALVIEGFFENDPVTVTILKGVVRTPRPPGAYQVGVSSWAFATQSQTVTFAAEAYSSCTAMHADYPTGVANDVAAQQRAVKAGYRSPLVNPWVYGMNKSLSSSVSGAACPTR
ncbi:MAG: hypothetical protein Q7K25_11390 [Actinomycetota bacterium]|nr:hypothetical protein [Actinomycetota bacterium]